MHTFRKRVHVHILLDPRLDGVRATQLVLGLGRKISFVLPDSSEMYWMRSGALAACWGWAVGSMTRRLLVRTQVHVRKLEEGRAEQRRGEERREQSRAEERGEERGKETRDEKRRRGEEERKGEEERDERRREETQ